MRAVKFSLSLLALFAVALSLSGCNTLANRRALYSPKKGDGYWTRTLDDGSWRDRGTRSADQTVSHGYESVGPAPAPILPPPAPLPEAGQPAI